MSILIELFVSKEKECFLAESIIINYSSNFYWDAAVKGFVWHFKDE